MTKDWRKRLESYLPFGSQWHRASTAPYNQELEVRILDNEEIVTLEFPCLRTNEESWINVDLGTVIAIEPVQWRAWHHLNAPQPHHIKIRPADRPAIIRNQLIERQDNDNDRNFG